MQATKPEKEIVREYFARRTHEEEPPPSLEEIRRQLGWKLLPSASDPNDSR